MPTTMSSGYSMFVEGPGKPIEGSGEPIEGPVKPIEGPGESIEGPGESIEDPSEPIEEADESIEEADESIKDPTEPIEKADERTLPIRVDGEMLMLMGMMQGIGRELLRKNVDDRSSTIEPEDVNQVTEMDYEDVNQVTEMDYEAWRVINYRRYHSKWCDADYMMPNDDRANTFLDKMDLCILSLQRSVGISSPYGTTMGGPSPERILDLGTGTGLWAWRAAKRFPDCEVIGTNISPTQYDNKLGNLTYLMNDFTSPDGLPFPDNHFDFVHMQCLAGSVKDWNALFREVWRVLRPNGWFESIECPFQVHTSGLNFIKACPALASIESVLEEAGSVIGRPMVVDSNDLDQSLKTAGFTIETNKCVPCPLSPQTPDVHQSIAAHFLKQALLTDIEGYFARILSEGHFWDENAVKRYADALKLELNDEVSMELFKPFINVQFMDGFKIQ